MITEVYQGELENKDLTAKEFMEKIESKFSKNKVVETRELFMKLSSMQYKDRGQVREHIYQMNTVAAKLGQLGMEVSDKMLMEFVLKSLPPRFDHFKLTYSIQEHKWSLEDLTSLCAQEELRLNEVNFESANFTSTSKSKKRKQEKINQRGALQKDHKRQKHDNALTCFHCRKPGHFKKDCKKYHAWREKKGNIITLVCTEVNLASVSTDTWWLDSGATIHVSMSMQGCLHCRKPRSEERYVFTGNDTSARVERIGTFRLLLNTGHFVDLLNTFVVPTFRRNLVSVSTLDKFGYTCTFGNRKVSIKYEDNIIGTGTLLQDSNLYLLNIVTPSNLILHTTMRGSKLKSTSSNSYSLWHRRLGHISQKRIDRLVVEGVLQPFDVRDIDKCVSCIKGKNTRTRGKGSSRATELLQLIHTDTCGPFPTATRNGHRYFITFTDDYSRYGYIYLIRDKSESLDTFKIFKAEVENQINKKIKGVRSDRGGEFYGRNDASGEQCPGSFARYLEQSGIVPQYTMPGTPSMNGIAERGNQTLQDMVRSMMAESSLHIRLWGEALKQLYTY